MARDALIRNVAAVAVAGCGLYFAFGLATAAAGYQPGTAIRDDKPISLALLWHEVSRVSFTSRATWAPLFSGCGLGITAALLLWFLATLLVAFTMAVNPRLFSRSRWAAVIAGLVLLLGMPVGLFGLISFPATLFNAFLLKGGLDGEWIREFGPMCDAAGILYLITCLLLFRLLRLPRRLPASFRLPAGHGIG
jgi:hypothetical protein